MSAGLIAQWVLVGLALLASVVHVARVRLPGPVARLRRGTTLFLLREGRPAWLRRVGRAIAPAPRVALPVAGGCGGCGERPQCGSHAAQDTLL
jgi:hypothetical protein